MESIKLTAEKRDLCTRGELNSMRKQGWIPSVLYGGAEKGPQKDSKKQNVLLKMNEKIFQKTLGNRQKSNVIIELKWADQTAHVLIKELQRNILTQQIIHVDFQQITMTQQLEVMVPIHLKGEAPGVKLSGGILEHITRELKISCLPKDMPSEIAVDVSTLEIGQGVSVQDLKEIPGVKILSDPHSLILNIVAPTILEETTASATASTTEPELIAKGKKPEEGEVAAVAPAAGGKLAEKTPAAPQKGGTPPAAGK